METDRNQAAQRIFDQLHQQLRAFNEDIPESPERLDAILAVLLRMYADQLAQIDGHVHRTWTEASQALIKAAAPEGHRWPVPAFTVMRCTTTDPLVEADRHTRFFYKEKREGGQTLFFSPLHTERLLAAQVKRLLLQFDSAVLDISPAAGSEQAADFDKMIVASYGRLRRIHIGVDYTGPQSALAGARLFLTGQPEALRQLRWGQWYPGGGDGVYADDSGFCPGGVEPFDSILAETAAIRDWGALRRTDDVLVALRDQFVRLPRTFTDRWQPGPLDPEVADVMVDHSGKEDALQDTNFDDHYYWMRADLSPAGDRSAFLEPLALYFDAMLVVNRNEQTLFKHTGGNRMVDLELPEPVASVLEIVSVTDSNGNHYRPAWQVTEPLEQPAYAMEVHRDRIILWFDFTHQLERPPDALTVIYATTAGTDANAIAADQITDLYESHPGISEAVNLISTGGAIPAMTEEDLVDQASSRLRNRDRALTFEEIANWARHYDPRVLKASCSHAVQRARRGIRRCVRVAVSIDSERFYSDFEQELLRRRLERFLKSRAPVNAQFEVEIRS
ncbi:MAG: hypothetical protein ABIE70_02405 [bacterium]